MPHMEITTVIGCRVQCTFCPQTLLMNKYEEKANINKITWGEPVIMGFDTFRTCIDKLPKDTEIDFSGFAEPWLDPECTKMILYAYEKGHRISVFTTLVGMKKEDVIQIKHVNFEKFVLHLPDKESYAKIAVNQQYIQVLKYLLSSGINNITCMCMGTIHPDIQKVIEISFPPDLMISRAGNCDSGVKSSKKSGPLLCGAANKNGINILDKNVLLPNGDVCLCCMDYGMEQVLGNLLSSDYASLFKGEIFQELLKKMNSESSEILCRNCNVAIPATIKKSDKEIDQIAEKYKKIVNLLYNKILLRNADTSGLLYYAHMLESKQMSIHDVEQKLMESPELKWDLEHTPKPLKRLV